MSIRPRNFSTLMLLGALTLSAGVALFGSTTAFADDEGDATGPCHAKTFKFAEVKAACAKGGKAEAKKLMTSIRDKVKAKDGTFKCKDCHENLKDYAQKDNAEEDYKKARAEAGYK